MKIKKALNRIVTGSVAFSAANMAHAAGGLAEVNTLMTSVEGVLTGVALITVTCAVLWAGYKILFGGQTFREVSPVVIGGVVIGACSEIASLLVGNL